MKVKLGRVDDIISAFDSINNSVGSIQRRQERTNRKLSGLSANVSSINTKVANQVEVLRTQVYLFSSNMGWLGIWDIAAGSYKGFINVCASDSGKITVSGETGNVFLLGENGNKIIIIDPYLPGISGTLQFNSVASFTVSPDGQRIFVSQNNSSVLNEVDTSSGKTTRNFTLPGTGLHLTFYPEAHLIYFSVAGTKAVYSIQRLSGEVVKVFDLPNDAVKMAPFEFGNKFGLLVLSGSGDSAAITRWYKSTGTTSTVQLANASEIVANPFTGQNYVVSLKSIAFRSLDGTVLKTVDLGDTASQLTLTPDGVHLIAVVSPGQNALIVDTITGVVSPGPEALYPPTQQTAQLLLAHAQFGFASN